MITCGISNVARPRPNSQNLNGWIATFGTGQYSELFKLKDCQNICYCIEAGGFFYYHSMGDQKLCYAEK